MAMTLITNRAMAVATATAIALTSFGVGSGALAAPVKTSQAGAQTATEFSARARHHRSHRRHHGNAAALGLFAATLGTIATIAAADRYRERYYYDGPYGYGGAPYGSYTGPSYGHRHWHRW
jgi:uncharacterized membrane protein YidH (DUF202 family)